MNAHLAGTRTPAEFVVLGDVEVRVHGVPVDIGPARQRCVLVALLVDADRVVSVDRLLDRIWAHRPPQRARDTLYGYVSRLRQALACAGDVALTRQSGGYLLSVDPLAVDLHRFRRLLAQARASDRDDQALPLLEQALALWKGEAFAHLDGPWVEALRGRLAGERLAAELDHNDAALRLGRHTGLLPAVSDLAAAHPLDERLAAQAMLTLYRCGRQAEALDHYRRTRLLLAEELGTDPGPALQELHQHILAADPGIAFRPQAAARRPAVPGTVPRQLPAPPVPFSGRAAELARLDAVLAGRGGPAAGMPIAVIAGTGGIGKTCLALRWAHDHLGQFPDGQLYVNLRGFDPSAPAVPPAVVARSFLHALGAEPASIPPDADAQIALYRTRMVGRRMLILLDNARDAEQVRPLLPGSVDCAILVTTRHQLPGLIVAEGAHPITLDVLSPDDARQMLTRRLGKVRTTGQTQALDDVIELSARLPLALSIVAARAAAHPDFPLRSLADDLAVTRGSLDAFTGDDATTDLRAVFSWSYHTLSADAARLFRLLGLHPGPDISGSAAAGLAAAPRTVVRSVLGELTRTNLLTEHVPQRYTHHDLLRAYSTELAREHESKAERRAARHRLFDHYLGIAYRASRLANPDRNPIEPPPDPGGPPDDPVDHQSALDWFEAEHPVLVAAIGQAAASGFDGHAWRLAWCMTTFLTRRGRWHDLAAVQAIALDAAQRLDSPLGQAHAHRDLALAHTQLGRYAPAHTHLRRAVELFGQLGDRNGQADTYLTLGWICELEGRQEEALRHDRRALHLLRTAGNRRGQGKALNAVGWDHAQLGDHRQAIAYCQQALALHQEFDNQGGAARTWDSIGFAHHHLGEYPRAIECFEQSLALYRVIEESYGQAETLIHLGDTREAIDDHAAARAAWRQALTVLDRLGHPDAEQVRARLARRGGR